MAGNVGKYTVFGALVGGLANLLRGKGLEGVFDGVVAGGAAGAAAGVAEEMAEDAHVDPLAATAAAAATFALVNEGATAVLNELSTQNRADDGALPS